MNVRGHPPRAQRLGPRSGHPAVREEVGDSRALNTWNDEMVERSTWSTSIVIRPIVRDAEGKRIDRALTLLAARADHQVLEIASGAGR